MKIVSINVEDEKHLERVMPLIETEQPDVLCLLEVCEKDLPHFQRLGYVGEFAPMTNISKQVGLLTIGTALLSRFPLSNIGSYYYRGSRELMGTYYEDGITQTQHKAVLHANVTIEEETYCIATTHFTWTPNGEIPNEAQIEDLMKLLAYTRTLAPHLICGDFNIPRHLNPLYERLLEYYTDNIPESYTSSLDPELHKLKDSPKGQLVLNKYMVDYMFTQSPYTATDVRLEFGLSDHAGVVATISKTR